MKTAVTNHTALIKVIDKQLKMILAKDVRKIDNVQVRKAAFLQLIAA